jgi:hypothetical protein
MQYSFDAEPTTSVRSRIPSSAAGWISGRFHRRVVDQPQVVIAAHGRQLLPLVTSQYCPGRHRGVHKKDGPRLFGDRQPQRIDVQPPFLFLDVVRDEARHAAHHSHPLNHAGVGGVGDNHLISGVGGGEDGIEQALVAARRDENLHVGVVLLPGTLLKVARNNLAEIHAAAQRKIAVVFVPIERRARGFDRSRRRAQVRLQRLQTKNFRVVFGRRRYAVDIETRNGVKTMSRAHTSIMVPHSRPMHQDPRTASTRHSRKRPAVPA